jgi:hypothetical protein
VERAQPGELRRLLRLGGAHQRDRPGGRGVVRSEERVDADDRQRAVVLALLVEHRLVLDAAALVAGLHRAEDAAALADPLELASTASSTRSVSSSTTYDPAAGSRCRDSPHSWSMIIWMASARRTDCSVGVVTASS